MHTSTATAETLPAIVRIDDVCRHFSVTRPTLRAWIKRGTFPAPTRPSGTSRGRVFWTAGQVRAALDKRAA